MVSFFSQFSPFEYSFNPQLEIDILATLENDELSELRRKLPPVPKKPLVVDNQEKPSAAPTSSQRSSLPPQGYQVSNDPNVYNSSMGVQQQTAYPPNPAPTASYSQQNNYYVPPPLQQYPPPPNYSY